MKRFVLLAGVLISVFSACSKKVVVVEDREGQQYSKVYEYNDDDYEDYLRGYRDGSGNR